MPRKTILQRRDAEVLAPPEPIITPASIIEKMLHLVQQRCGCRLTEWGKQAHILDPSVAGDAALSNALRQRWPDARVTSIDASAFLYHRFHRGFDAVVMHPPRATYLGHIVKAWSLLSSGGVLVAVVPADFAFNNASDVEVLRARLCDRVILPLEGDDATLRDASLVVATRPTVTA